MTTILHIEVSPNKDQSASRKVGKVLVEGLQKKHSGSIIKNRDLNSETLPHISGEVIGAAYTPEDKRTSEQQRAIAQSDELVDELLGSDVIVIATPMWNFGVPSVLKAWIDHIVRVGRTFSFSEKGPDGLVKNKKVYVVVSSGSVFSEGDYKAFDFVAPYFKAVFGFLGTTDVEIIRVEGTNNPNTSANAIQKAITAVEALLKV